MSPQRATLRAIDFDEPRRRVFCGYCAHRPEGGTDRVSPESRVCGECGLGLLLTADEALLPAPDDAFLVVDAGLTIRALSQAAERLFEVAETDVVDQALDNVIVAAEASDEARGNLVRLLSGAAREPLSAREPDVAVIRPARTFGIRFRARIGRCEPGRAALLVLSRL
jgi:hypothetical protein